MTRNPQRAKENSDAIGIPIACQSNPLWAHYDIVGTRSWGGPAPTLNKTSSRSILP